MTVRSKQWSPGALVTGAALTAVGFLLGARVGKETAYRSGIEAAVKYLGR